MAINWENVVNAATAGNSGLNILQSIGGMFKFVRTKRNESQLAQQNALMQQAFDFNEQAARKQMEREMHMNSPLTKRKQLEAAGMNPMLAVEGASMGASMGGVSGAPQADSPANKEAAQAAQAQARSQALMTIGQIKLMQSQANQANAAADLSAAEAEKIRTSTPVEIAHIQSLTELANQQAATESVRRDAQRAETAIMQVRQRIEEATEEIQKEQFLKNLERTEWEIENLIEETLNSKMSREVQAAMIAKTFEEMMLLGVEAKLKNEMINSEKSGQALNAQQIERLKDQTAIEWERNFQDRLFTAQGLNLREEEMNILKKQGTAKNWISGITGLLNAGATVVGLKALMGTAKATTGAILFTPGIESTATGNRPTYSYPQGN